MIGVEEDSGSDEGREEESKTDEDDNEGVSIEALDSSKEVDDNTVAVVILGFNHVSDS